MEDILLVHRKSNINFDEGFDELFAEAAIFGTCIRKMLFCDEADLLAYQEALRPEDQILRGEKAISFLLEILCGLHSPIIGETQVFGQFKQFVDDRKKLGDILFGDHQKWLNFIMAEVKKVRTEHIVGLGSQSYGSLIRRNTKDLDSVAICGSGQLALEILPWLAHKKSIQMICRDPSKLQAFEHKYENLKVDTYNNAFIHGEALVIAAPITDERIVELLNKQDTRPKYIYDLRGEENQLQEIIASQFSHITYTGLHKFFAEIEETKKDTTLKLEAVKQVLLEKAIAFKNRTELRPLGWDDICA